MDISESAGALRTFCGEDLTATLALIEKSLQGVSGTEAAKHAAAHGAAKDVLSAAGELKRLAAQVNVVIHALGILLCLERLLEPDETIEYVSLGAGNTGKPFDLETDQRIAEFKFINWRGGAEAIRQNAVFKDFFLLAEHKTRKRTFLYVLGSDWPLKFLNGGRALSSVLSRNVKLGERFRATFGDRFKTVRDYYQVRKSAVTIQDVSPWLGPLLGDTVELKDTAV